MNCAAIIVAAGRGNRFSDQKISTPKQYLNLVGVTVLDRSVRPFIEHPSIDGVVVVIHPDDKQIYDSCEVKHIEKILSPVFGGASRQASVLAGLDALRSHNPEYVLIHDAARPFVTPVLLDRLLNRLNDGLSAIPALPLADTLKLATNNRIDRTIDRTNLWLVQTPQGFPFDKIHAAHKRAVESGKSDFTDDASIAEWSGMEVELVAGDIHNFKLTTKEDFNLGEKILTIRELDIRGSTRVGTGYDVHAFEDGDHVVICGVKISHTRSLKGHSDADVGLHALTDAILGALGDGDIGTHFPPSDPQWAGKSSEYFLADALERVRSRQGDVKHVDVTLICEYPKIAPHRNAMKSVISGILNLKEDQVSVKATTTEGLGFCGREEGIAAMASATIWMPDTRRS